MTPFNPLINDGNDFIFSLSKTFFLPSPIGWMDSPCPHHACFLLAPSKEKSSLFLQEAHIFEPSSRPLRETVTLLCCTASPFSPPCLLGAFFL